MYRSKSNGDVYVISDIGSLTHLDIRAMVLNCIYRTTNEALIQNVTERNDRTQSVAGTSPVCTIHDMKSGTRKKKNKNNRKRTLQKYNIIIYLYELQLYHNDYNTTYYIIQSRRHPVYFLQVYIVLQFIKFDIQ